MNSTTIPQETLHIAKTAVPLMAAFLVQKGMQLIDTLMMGWLGPSALAAGALSTPVFMLMVVFCMGILSSVGIFIARARGAGQEADIARTLHGGIMLVLLLSPPAMLAIWHAPQALAWFGEDPAVVANAAALLHGLVWGFPGFLLFLVWREFISAFALTVIVLVVSLISIPLTYVLNDAFIYGKYGLPALGVAGIGYAGALVMWGMALGMFAYARRQPQLRPHLQALPRLGLGFDWPLMRSMLALGTPSGLLLVLDTGMFSAAALMMSRFGVETLAAYQIALQCATIAYTVPVALSMATALQVGNAAGASDMPRARRSAMIGLALGVLLSGLIALMFVLAPGLLAQPFLEPNQVNQTQILTLAASFLAVAGLFQGFDAVQTIVNGALKGLKDTLWPMLLCIGCYWILGIGSGWYLAFHTTLGARGVWYGMLLGIGSAALVLLLRFYLKSGARSRSAPGWPLSSTP